MMFKCSRNWITLFCLVCLSINVKGHLPSIPRWNDNSRLNVKVKGKYSSQCKVDRAIVFNVKVRWKYSYILKTSHLAKGIHVYDIFHLKLKQERIYCFSQLLAHVFEMAFSFLLPKFLEHLFVKLRFEIVLQVTANQL